MVRPARLPPLHALSAFESAARLGGFAPAAAELCITPSAVSHRIRLLEAQLGEQLFERTPGGVRLTEAGRRCLAGVREAFGTLAQLSRGRDDAPVRLVVGTPPTFARELLIPQLPDFYRQWPDIELEVAVAAPLQERPQRHDVDIRYGADDLGVADGRPLQRLFDDRWVLLAAPAYVQAQGLAVPADLLRAERLRSPLVSWATCWQAAGLTMGSAPGAAAEPQRGPVFSDLGILLEAAASGLGVALCSERLAQRWVAEGRLQTLFDLAVPAERHYGLLADAVALARPEVGAFVDWLVARLG